MYVPWLLSWFPQREGIFLVGLWFRYWILNAIQRLWSEIARNCVYISLTSQPCSLSLYETCHVCDFVVLECQSFSVSGAGFVCTVDWLLMEKQPISFFDVRSTCWKKRRKGNQQFTSEIFVSRCHKCFPQIIIHFLWLNIIYQQSRHTDAQQFKENFSGNSLLYALCKGSLISDNVYMCFRMFK